MHFGSLPVGLTWLLLQCLLPAAHGQTTSVVEQRPTATLSSASAGSATATSRISINPTVPAGAISFINPNPASKASYIKILPSSTMTLSWTYTDLAVTPTSLTLQVYCSANQHVYTIGSVAGNQHSIAWNIDAQASATGAVPWIDAVYILQAFPTRLQEAASPGFLMPYQGASLLMYKPTAYTPLSEWTCVGCSGGFKVAPNLLVLLPTVVCVVLGAIHVAYRRPTLDPPTAA